MTPTDTVAGVNMSISVTGAAAPTDEETAAIMAAAVALWPRAAAHDPVPAPRNTAWRFSSRNWVGPVPVRRFRPWR